MDHSRAAGVSQVVMKPVTVDDLMQIFGSRRADTAAPTAAREASWARS
jgi:hypothetical protein